MSKLTISCSEVWQWVITLLTRHDALHHATVVWEWSDPQSFNYDIWQVVWKKLWNISYAHIIFINNQTIHQQILYHLICKVGSLWTGSYQWGKNICKWGNHLACKASWVWLGCLSFSSPGARFSKAPETFQARKAILRSPVSKNGEVYTPETSCMKETFLHL